MNQYALGILLPQEIKKSIFSIQSGIPNITWLNPEDLFFPVQFFGLLSAEDRLDLLSLLDTFSFPVLNLKLAKIKVSINKHNSGFIYSELEASSLPLLQKFAKDLKEHIKPLNLSFSKERKEFQTLIGSFKNTNPEFLSYYLESKNSFLTPSWHTEIYSFIEIPLNSFHISIEKKFLKTS